MLAQVDVETVRFILSHFSEDIAYDCCKIIDKLLKTLPVSNILDEKVIASVKVLLTFYESLNPNNANTKVELPINIILEKIQLIFQCNNDICNLPGKNVQNDILSIISSAFKNGFLQNTSRSLEQLAEFYIHNLTNISTAIAKKECKSDCLIFKLKSMTAIHQTLGKTEFESYNIGFFEKINSLNYLEEFELLATLALHEDDEIAFQTLFHLIPAQIICNKSIKVVEVIWKKISAFMSSDILHSRALIILCQVFDLCFDKTVLKDCEKLTGLLFEDVNYWKLVQFAIKDRDSVKRKQGLYLFKKAIDILNKENKNYICGQDDCVFYWDSDCKDNLTKVYKEVIIILEFLEEQQMHIIEPIFKLVETVNEEILKSNTVSFSWILVIHEKALVHESLRVVRWGISSLLSLPEKFFLNKHIAKETAELLAATLNNMSLFFNNGLALSEELWVFFNRIARLSINKIFFSNFIKKLCRQVWSAEALFFVIRALTERTKKHPVPTFWGEEEISEIITFVSKAFKTHNKIIRNEVQNELLNACFRFTHVKNITLESIIHLISIIFERKALQVGSESWCVIIHWLRTFYSVEDARNVLEQSLKENSNIEPQCIATMFILFYCAYDSELQPSMGDKFVLSYFNSILCCFKEIHKRPYCNKQKYNRTLSIIYNVYKSGLSYPISAFIKPSLPLVEDVILYIQTQLLQLSGLQDFNELELYMNSLECIIKTLTVHEFHTTFTSSLFMEVLNDFQYFVQTNSKMSSIGVFWRIKFLSIMLDSDFISPKPSFLDSYLLKSVNESLKKDDDYSDKTRDVLVLWGKINSQYLEHKWRIFNYLIDNKIIVHGCEKTDCWISNDDLVGLCVEALTTGGYGVLQPIMSILGNLLPVMENIKEVKRIVDSIWKLIMERRKTEEFKELVGKFVKMVFQEAFIAEKEPVGEILMEYTDVIFADPSIAVVNILMKHIQKMETMSVRLFCHIIGKGLIYGAVEKRDDRLIRTVYTLIQSIPMWEMGDFNTSDEIRARAVQTVLKLKKNRPEDKIIARELMDCLLKMENELNKNRSRYYGNSHVHRVKHRLMQALLLLEPFLNENEDQAITLSKWIIHCLLTENSQPSVRYMQEWLLVRMIVRHSQIYSSFSINNYCNGSEENKKRGCCSLIAVTYHLCRLIPRDLIENRIASDISSILYFCFHRHFELRLYAQVAFWNIYDGFAKSKELEKTIEKYESVYKAITGYFKEECEKNKNLWKLINNFYFQDFHPLNHYNLETIYEDLPKLADVSSDEWISVKMFEHCLVNPVDIDIPLRNLGPSLTSKNNWLLKKFDFSTENDDRKSELLLDNYQKKVIPIKPFIPGCDETHSCLNSFKKDGLIVVASLIDRIPNLGGLARTCEVFGASEYIINSLRYTEDKQFTSLSVTAEKWITVKEVKIQNLLNYVSEMKQDGYTIIGAEQALHSQPLNAVKFPKKSLFLLGNEKEGIPPNLLPFLDVCVEIPQLGLIRSLNVHVTGALFIWEYAKQHHFS